MAMTVHWLSETADGDLETCSELAAIRYFEAADEGEDALFDAFEARFYQILQDFGASVYTRVCVSLTTKAKAHCLAFLDRTDHCRWSCEPRRPPRYLGQYLPRQFRGKGVWERHPLVCSFSNELLIFVWLISMSRCSGLSGYIYDLVGEGISALLCQQTPTIFEKCYQFLDCQSLPLRSDESLEALRKDIAPYKYREQNPPSASIEHLLRMRTVWIISLKSTSNDWA